MKFFGSVGGLFAYFLISSIFLQEIKGGGPTVNLLIRTILYLLLMAPATLYLERKTQVFATFFSHVVKKMKLTEFPLNQQINEPT